MSSITQLLLGNLDVMKLHYGDAIKANSGLDWTQIMTTSHL
jgi:hypothetical protein